MIELYNVTIAQDPVSGDYLGGVYCVGTQEHGGIRNKNLYKVLNEVSRRIKNKEKERRNFPVKQEDSTNLIVLPNGRVNEALS